MLWLFAGQNLTYAHDKTHEKYTKMTIRTLEMNEMRLNCKLTNDELAGLTGCVCITVGLHSCTRFRS